MSVNYDECEAAGLDPKVIGRLSKRMGKVMDELHKLGVGVFGGSGTLLFHYEDNESLGPLIVGDVNSKCSVSGGDGGSEASGDGLMRGEY